MDFQWSCNSAAHCLNWLELNPLEVSWSLRISMPSGLRLSSLVLTVWPCEGSILVANFSLSLLRSEKCGLSYKLMSHRRENAVMGIYSYWKLSWLRMQAGWISSGENDHQGLATKSVWNCKEIKEARCLLLSYLPVFHNRTCGILLWIQAFNYFFSLLYPLILILLFYCLLLE